MPRIFAAGVELLAEAPFWATTKEAERLDVAYTPAQRFIGRLETASIPEQVGQVKSLAGDKRS